MLPWAEQDTPGGQEVVGGLLAGAQKAGRWPAALGARGQVMGFVPCGRGDLGTLCNSGRSDAK